MNLNHIVSLFFTYEPNYMRSFDFHSDIIFDKEGCLKKVPSFGQFITYVVDYPDEHDAHWARYRHYFHVSEYALQLKC